MKKTRTRELETVNAHVDTESIEKQTYQTLRILHEGMTKRFGIDFPFFSKVKVIPHQEILNQLTQHIRDDFEKSGLTQSGIEWKQIDETLARSQNAALFGHFAFYCPDEDILYMNKTMMTSYPEKVVSVCAHELAEKLLSACTSSPTESSMQPAVRLYLEAGKTNSTKKMQALLDKYIETVFKTVFREGCCESIATETMRWSSFVAEAVALEKELRIGYPKCVVLLSSLENERKSWGHVEMNQLGSQPLCQIRKTIEILRTAQIIKGVSYYIGFPLAKAVLEKYGIQGLRVATETNLPLRTQYFADPQTFLALFEKTIIHN